MASANTTESYISAQVNKQRERNQEPCVKFEEMYANITPPVPRKNMNLKKEIERKKIISKSECGRDMMALDREVKALAHIRKPLIPRPEAPEPPQVPEQYVNKVICETTEASLSEYSNVSPETKARPKQHPISVRKGNFSKKPIPEPRSRLKPVRVDGYGNSSNELVTSRGSDSIIYEDPLPVNPALVEGMPERDTMVNGSSFEDTQLIHEACVIDRGEPTCEASEAAPGTSEKMTPAGYAVGDSFCLYIYVADITKLTVDAIVNDANETLFHGTGIAGVIAEAAGPKLIKESEALVKRNRLRTTEVVKTTSGNLPCKAVLHAVGPKWPKTTDANMISACRREIMDTYINIIDKANSEHYRSTALPLISSGVFGFPRDIVIKALIDALLSSSVKCQRSKLKEVHIVDIKDDLLELLARQLSERDIHRAPNGMQVAITELPKAEVERALTGNSPSGIKPRRNKWLCGLDRRKKKH